MLNITENLFSQKRAETFGIVLQTGGFVETAGGEAKAQVVERTVGFAQDVAESVVGNLIGDADAVGRFVVFDPVVDRVQVIGQRPQRVAAGVLVGQKLINARPP